MASTINLSLPDELQQYVRSRSGDDDVYGTPDEFIRDLIRRDMEEWQLAKEVATGMREAREGKFVDGTILDILNED